MLPVGLPGPILLCWAARVDSIRRAPSATWLIYTDAVMLPSPVSRLRHDACTRYGGIRRRSSAVQPGPHLSARRATKQWATAVSQRPLPTCGRRPRGTLGPDGAAAGFCSLRRSIQVCCLSLTHTRRFLLIRARLRLRSLYLWKNPTGDGRSWQCIAISTG